MAVDFGSMATLASSFKTMTDILNAMSGVRDANLLQTKIFELTREIVAAQSSAVTAQTAQMELLRQVQALEDELRRQREFLNLRDRLVYEAPLYWLQQPDGRDGPYCQVCWDRDNKLIRLQADSSDPYWRCFGCERMYPTQGVPRRGTTTLRSDFDPFDI